MYGYVYLTENIISGRCYIGQHKSNLFDESYCGSGIALQDAIKSYGKSNFITTVIEWCNTKKELDARERFWIDHCDAVNSDLFYNLCDGGYGGKFLTGDAEKRRIANLKKSCNDPEMLAKRIKSYKETMANKTDEERMRRGANISKALRSRSIEDKEATRIKHSNSLTNANDEKKRHKSESIKNTLANRSNEEKILQRKRYSDTINNQSKEQKALRRLHISEGVKRRLEMNRLKEALNNE